MARVSANTLGFGGDPKAGRGLGKLCIRKRESCRGDLIGGYWPGEAKGRLNRSRVSYMIG